MGSDIVDALLQRPLGTHPSNAHLSPLRARTQFAANLYATEAEKKRVWKQLRAAAFAGAAVMFVTAILVKKR